MEKNGHPRICKTGLGFFLSKFRGGYSLKILQLTYLLQIFLFLPTAFAGNVKTDIEKPVEEAISTLQQTQSNEEKWRQTQDKLLVELETLQLHVKQLTKNRDQLKSDITLSQQRIKTKQQKLADIRRIEQEMDPFLEQVSTRLQHIPERDLPFLQKERKTRFIRLNSILHDPDISISEKYRKTMEALQIEAEFGITIETYQAMVKHGNQTILANILRLGRLGLYYVTLDENGCGFFNIADNNWQQLPDSQIHSLQTGIDIAARRQPAEFLTIPLGRMVKK